MNYTNYKSQTREIKRGIEEILQTNLPIDIGESIIAFVESKGFLPLRRGREFAFENDSTTRLAWWNTNGGFRVTRAIARDIIENRRKRYGEQVAIHEKNYNGRMESGSDYYMRGAERDLAEQKKERFGEMVNAISEEFLGEIADTEWGFAPASEEERTPPKDWEERCYYCGKVIPPIFLIAPRWDEEKKRWLRTTEDEDEDEKSNASIWRQNGHEEGWRAETSSRGTLEYRNPDSYRGGDSRWNCGCHI